MASISIRIDRSPFASISLGHLTMLDVSVTGALNRESKCDLSAGGGDFRECGRGYLIFVDQVLIKAGQVISVMFTAGTGSGDPGHTIAELYPDAAPCPRADFSITEEMAAELRARPMLHEAFTAQVETSCGSHAIATSDRQNTDFTFRVLWTDDAPDTARVHFTTCCLNDVLARRCGTTYLRATMALGGVASFTLLP